MINFCLLTSFHLIFISAFLVHFFGPFKCTARKPLQERDVFYLHVSCNTVTERKFLSPRIHTYSYIYINIFFENYNTPLAFVFIYLLELLGFLAPSSSKIFALLCDRCPFSCNIYVCLHLFYLISHKSFCV